MCLAARTTVQSCCSKKKKRIHTDQNRELDNASMTMMNISESNVFISLFVLVTMKYVVCL